MREAALLGAAISRPVLHRPYLLSRIPPGADSRSETAPLDPSSCLTPGCPQPVTYRFKEASLCQEHAERFGMVCRTCGEDMFARGDWRVCNTCEERS